MAINKTHMIIVAVFVNKNSVNGSRDFEMKITISVSNLIINCDRLTGSVFLFHNFNSVRHVLKNDINEGQNAIVMLITIDYNSLHRTHLPQGSLSNNNTTTTIVLI